MKCTVRRPHLRRVRRRRSGITILEVAVSAMVLGAAVTSAAQLVQWSSALHQAALKRRCALEAATSMLDRVTARDWTSITPQSVKDLPLPTETKEFLGDPRLAVTVTDEAAKDAVATKTSGPIEAKKVSVEISWAQREDKRSQKVQLTTWVFQPGKAK